MPLYGVPAYDPGPGDGLPDLLVPGSGSAVPAGMEAVLEFNGLRMNIMNDLERYRISNIDGLGDSDIRDTRDQNTEDDGETPFNSFLGGRSIVITGTVEAYTISKLRDMQMALRGAFADTKVERPLIFRTGNIFTDHKIMCKKIAPIAMAETQQNRKIARDFQLTLRASNPRFLTWYQSSKIITVSPSTVPIEVAELINSGNYWADPIYRIYGPSASTTIKNDWTGRSFTVTNVPYENYVEFDIAKKTLVDQNGINYFNQLADNSDFVKLHGRDGSNPTGSNPIIYIGDSPRVEIFWYHSWV